MSPLVAAALASSVSTLQLLLIASAFADATDQHQRTALTAAAATGSLPLPGKMFEKFSFHFFLEVWDERIPAQCGYCIFRCDVKINIYIHIYIYIYIIIAFIIIHSFSHPGCWESTGFPTKDWLVFGSCSTSMMGGRIYSLIFGSLIKCWPEVGWDA